MNKTGRNNKNLPGDLAGFYCLRSRIKRFLSEFNLIRISVFLKPFAISVKLIFYLKQSLVLLI